MVDIQQYLTFTLAGEQYGVSVLRVREVLEYTTITKIPRMAAFMKGVINLRGTAIPVVDLRSKFGMPEIEITKDTSIIVMEVITEEGPIILGALADSVQEVVELESSQIEEAPNLGTKIANSVIKGIGKRNDHFILILDIDKIFNTDDVIQLNQMEELKEQSAQVSL